MDRMYLLIAGILTGAAIGLLTGHLGWLCAGLIMGGLLALAARPRRKSSGASTNVEVNQELRPDSR